MSPLEYLFSSVRSLEAIDPQPAKVCSVADAAMPALLSTPAERSIAFEGSADLARWAFYRRLGDYMQIVSPFGCCHLPCWGLDMTKPVGLMSLRPNGEASAWEIQFDDQWRGASGNIAPPDALKARALPNGEFEPLHTCLSFRGSDSKPSFWAIVLLPSAAERIYSKDGSARIEAGGRVFAIPSGKASEHVLAGRVQWGLPDQNGFFVLQKRQA